MVDAYFNALAKQRKHAQFEKEREALAYKKRLAKVRAQSGAAKVISIDAPIGVHEDEISAKWLRAQLPTDGRDVVLQVHSEGGLVFETMAMVDILRAYPGRVKAVVSSMALSSASLLICGGCDEIEITKGAYLMLHDAHMGDADDLSDSDNQLIGSLVTDMADIYAARSRKPVHEIRKMMAAETWFNAADAVRHGFADRIVDASSLRIVARAIPKKIVAQRKAAALGKTATSRWNAAVAKAGSVVLANKQNPGLRLKMLAEVNGR